MAGRRGATLLFWREFCFEAKAFRCHAIYQIRLGDHVSAATYISWVSMTVFDSWSIDLAKSDVGLWCLRILAPLCHRAPTPGLLCVTYKLLEDHSDFKAQHGACWTPLHLEAGLLGPVGEGDQA